jgi:hypothetical protein
MSLLRSKILIFNPIVERFCFDSKQLYITKENDINYTFQNKYPIQNPVVHRRGDNPINAGSKFVGSNIPTRYCHH